MDVDELPVDWLELKKKALRRDDFQCVNDCSRSAALYAAYIEHPGEGGWGLENIVTLCSYHTPPQQRTEAQLAFGTHKPDAPFDPHYKDDLDDHDERSQIDSAPAPKPAFPEKPTASGLSSTVTLSIPKDVARSGRWFLGYRTYFRNLRLAAFLLVPTYLLLSLLWGVVNMWTQNSMRAGFQVVGQYWMGAIDLTWKTATTPEYFLVFFGTTYFLHLLSRDYLDDDWPEARATLQAPAYGVIGSIAVYLLFFALAGLGAYTDVVQDGFQWYVVVIGGFLGMLVALLALVICMADLLVNDTVATNGGFRPFFWDYLMRMSAVIIVAGFAVPPRSEAFETATFVAPVAIAVTYLLRRRLYVTLASRNGSVPLRRWIRYWFDVQYAKATFVIGRLFDDRGLQSGHAEGDRDE